MKRKLPSYTGNKNPVKRPEVREKIRKTMQRKMKILMNTPEMKKKIRDGMCKSPAFQKWQPWNKDLTEYTNSILKRVSLRQIELNRNEVFREKRARASIKARNIHPNKLERRVNSYLEKNFPKEWIFAGDGKIILGCKIPDFVNVNGQKKIIEVFGDYWHESEDVAKRLKHFKKFGYDTLVIWGHELFSPVGFEKIKMFALSAESGEALSRCLL